MTDTNQDPNYQDILNKYADSLKPSEALPSQDQAPSPQDQLESVPEPSVSVPEITPPPTMLEPDPTAEMLPDTEPQTAVMTEANSESIAFSPPTSDTTSDFDKKPAETVTEPPKDFSIPQPEVQIPPSMQDYVDSSKTDKLDSIIPSPPMTSDSFIPPAPHPINIAPDIEVPKENHFFKYLFFFSLIIFIVVAALLAYSFYRTQKSTTDVKSVPTNTPPTGLPASKCLINGEEYDIGQSFPASDGCNTCSCDKDLLIACTTMACDASNSATPTESTTISAVSKTAQEACQLEKFTWLSKYSECEDASSNPTNLQKLKTICETYKGTLNETADSCRHVTEPPCGPEAVAVCSFAVPTIPKTTIAP
ncbi:MAG TPA: hypothetical protein VN174_00475 [Candidatus Methanoperedens sp.]|nr:hypothetical protein [Candidatus Methanoperedens sp.]